MHVCSAGIKVNNQTLYIHNIQIHSARCTTNLMARVVLIAVVLVIFIQLASSQDSQPCIDATNSLRQCSNDTVCSNPCRGYFNDFVNNCGEISGSFITPTLVRRCMHS